MLGTKEGMSWPRLASASSSVWIPKTCGLVHSTVEHGVHFFICIAGACHGAMVEVEVLKIEIMKADERSIQSVETNCAFDWCLCFPLEPSPSLHFQGPLRTWSPDRFLFFRGHSTLDPSRRPACQAQPKQRSLSSLEKSDANLMTLKPGGFEWKAILCSSECCRIGPFCSRWAKKCHEEMFQKWKHHYWHQIFQAKASSFGPMVRLSSRPGDTYLYPQILSLLRNPWESTSQCTWLVSCIPLLMDANRFSTHSFESPNSLKPLDFMRDSWPNWLKTS